MTKVIKVYSCQECPLSRLLRARDNRFCDHAHTDGMDVEGYKETIHPNCPLDNLKGGL